MLSSLSSIQVVLWIAGIAIQLALATILLQRRSFRFFPWFNVYIFQANAAALILLAVGKFGSVNSYSIGFYAASILDSLTAVLAICEFFILTFGPQSARPPILTMYLASAMAFAYLVTGSIGTIFLAENPWRRGEQLFIALGTATLWVFFLCKERLGLHWTRRTAGIGRGMLIYLTSELATAFLNGRVERSVSEIAGVISQLAYITAVIFWIRAIWPQETPLTPPSQEDLSLVRSVLGEGGQAIEELHESREAAFK